jgi:hypothetical protein
VPHSTDAAPLVVSRRELLLGIAAAAAGLTFAGCKAVPLGRPMNTSPIAAGPETIEAIRRQLEGQWTLLGLSVTSSDGKLATVDATGVLTSDAFGNLEIEYRMSESGLKSLAAIGVTSPNPVISTKGRATIDAQQRAITYMSEKAETQPLDAELAARRANPFALERTRYFVFAPDGTLTLSTRHDDGRDAVVSRWKKGP